MILWSLFDGYQHFGGACCLGLQDNLQLFYSLLPLYSIWFTEVPVFIYFIICLFLFPFSPLTVPSESVCASAFSIPSFLLPLKMGLWRVRLSYSAFCWFTQDFSHSLCPWKIILFFIRIDLLRVLVLHFTVSVSFFPCLAFFLSWRWSQQFCLPDYIA